MSAGPLVVCVWSGRWSREEVRRKPVARLLKDAALMNGTVANKAKEEYYIQILLLFLELHIKLYVLLLPDQKKAPLT